MVADSSGLSPPSSAANTSAVVAVIDERWVADLERSLNEAQAKKVLDHKLATPEPSGKQQGQSPSTTPQKSGQPNP